VSEPLLTARDAPQSTKTPVTTPLQKGDRTPDDTTDRPITVLVVDDHPLLRDGIASALSGQADIQLVAEAADGQSAIAQFLQHRPDVTLMELRLPDMSGIDAMCAIRERSPKARIILLSTLLSDSRSMQALAKGAAGLLRKTIVRTELRETIRSVHAGKRSIPHDLMMDFITHASASDLSEREVEIIASAATGSSNKFISQQLAITEETVKFHMKNIFAKLGARGRTHAVVIALRRGIVDV
jgi:DNA-binding NarL/FixJ family response regulator